MLGIKYGETCPLKFKCIDKSSNPIDMTNATLNFVLQDEVNDIEDCAVIKKTITKEVNENGCITDESNGRFYILFTPEDYEKLYKGRVYYLTIWMLKGDCKKNISSVSGNLCPFTIFYP